MLRYFCYLFLCFQIIILSLSYKNNHLVDAFTQTTHHIKLNSFGVQDFCKYNEKKSSVVLHLAKSPAVTEKEAQTAINKVTKTLQSNREACADLGKLQKVTNVLGYGSPRQNTIAVRFNASFAKSGRGMTAKPLPFMLGQSNEKEGRGTMVGQVKASLDRDSLKILECSVFRDLGYGRAFNLKV